MSSETSPEPKARYRGPDIVDVGSVAAVTTGKSTPVRDNDRGRFTYHDSNTGQESDDDGGGEEAETES